MRDVGTIQHFTPSVAQAHAHETTTKAPFILFFGSDILLESCIVFRSIRWRIIIYIFSWLRLLPTSSSSTCFFVFYLFSVRLVGAGWVGRTVGWCDFGMAANILAIEQHCAVICSIVTERNIRTTHMCMRSRRRYILFVVA